MSLRETLELLNKLGERIDSLTCRMRCVVTRLKAGDTPCENSWLHQGIGELVPTCVKKNGISDQASH